MDLIPTILGRTEAEVHQQTRMLAGVSSRVHLDIMDGQFVPESTPLNLGALFDPAFSYDLHLMVADPLQFAPVFHRREIHTVYVHAELSTHTLHHFFENTSNIPIRCGLGLNLETPISVLRHYEGRFKSVLLMSVVPGNFGRPFDARVIDRIVEVRSMFGNDVTIAVDGGINEHTIPLIKHADAAMVHHAIFSGTSLPECFRALQQLAAKA